MLTRRDLSRLARCFLQGAAAFLRLLRDVYLQQHPQRRLCSAIQLRRQLDGINGVHELESTGHDFGFVALEVPDQMPPNPQLPTPSS